MKYKFKKIDFFLILLLGIIILITIFAALNPNFGEFFSVQNWFATEAISKVSFWTAAGFTMLVCFLGALIPFPIPYTIPITLFSAAWYKSMGVAAWPLIIALVFLATIANTIGDMIDYFIGKGAQYVMSKEDPEVQNRWSQIILKHPKAIPPIIVLFGITPLPDSLLMVPLGIAEYNIKKTFIWMFISRLIMMTFSAIIGVYAIKWAFGEGSSEGPIGQILGSWIVGIVILYLIWLVIAIMVKYKPKETKNISNDLK